MIEAKKSWILCILSDNVDIIRYSHPTPPQANVGKVDNIQFVVPVLERGLWKILGEDVGEKRST